MSKYAIISSSHLSSYDFAYLGDIRKSLDGALAVVEWEGADPQWVVDLSASSITQEEASSVMSTEEWTAPLGLTGSS